MNNRVDIVQDVFLLSSLVMEGHCGELSKVQGLVCMSISGRLVTHMCRFGRRKPVRLSTSSRTSSLGVGMPELLGHSSSASTMT
jgi:uncharacterized protein YsxB (DUF464 family)